LKLSSALGCPSGVMGGHKEQRPTRVLSAADVEGLCLPPAIIGAVEAAARCLEAGSASVPSRLHLDWGSNTLLVMPAVAEDTFGTKLVSVVPGNAARGLAVINGLMVLNEGDTGVLLALFNAAALTATRTGAVGALGLKYLTPAETTSVGIVGCGVQGTWQAIFACAARPVQEIFCWSRNPASIERFAAIVQRHSPGIPIMPCAHARELLDRTDVVITATRSAEPVLPDDPALLEGKHFVSIGSFKPNMRELPDAVFRLAGHLVLDSEFARHEVGDAIRPVEQGILTERDLFPIGKLVTGERAVDPTRTTAYKSTGMALFDLFVARALYEAADRHGVGLEIRL
jgi:ornithine cyclodeaminase/alanine dehydrogenase-like protein (mu-crystallin family)